MRHPAREMEFGALFEGLQIAKEAKLVSESRGPDGLLLYCYSDACVYDRQWNPVTLAARGLILDPARKQIVATPFPKFFNVGERAEPIPDLAFETFEKLDGSLIIIYHHAGVWTAATKGSFASEQAKWARSYLARSDLSAFTVGTTYLAEFIGPENRIVVHYQSAALVLLAAYAEDGSEVSYADLIELAGKLAWPIARRHAFAGVSELVVHAQGLPPSEEGFVLRFENGLRLKVKGDEYRRIHALISHLTPLAMWEAMLAGDDLQAVRRDLPEEFWADFDQIISIITNQLQALMVRTKLEAQAVAHLSDKEVGLQLDKFPEDVRRFIFPYRRFGSLTEGKTRQGLFRAIRPTANRLPGYQPSFAMNRVMEEAA